MNINFYKTSKIKPNDDLYEMLDEYLPKIKERNIVVITSKIVSICQKRIIKKENINKEKLVYKESDYYLDKKYPKPYGYILTIKNNILIPNAGIDESNGNNNLILWPSEIQKATENIWEHLKRKHKVKMLGVIITDSKTTPLRWGTTGVCLSWCGIEALKNYIGTPDIFGNTLKVTKSNIVDGLAASAVLGMGEGNEQTPLAIIKDVPFVKFQNRIPSKKEINQIKLNINEDLYSPILCSVKWRKN